MQGIHWDHSLRPPTNDPHLIPPPGKPDGQDPIGNLSQTIEPLLFPAVFKIHWCPRQESNLRHQD